MNASAAAPPFRRRLPLLVAAVLVLAAVVWLRRAEPDYDAKVAPIVLPGAVGQRVQARNFAVEVKKAKLAHAYLTKAGLFDAAPRTVASDGIWMSLLVEAEPLDEPGFISAQLRTRDGLIYRASDHGRPELGGSNFNGQELLTGLRGTGAYFFDVPPDRLEGAHAQFYWGNVTPGQMDHLIDIDLGLDAAATRKLLAGAPPTLDLR